MELKKKYLNPTLLTNIAVLSTGVFAYLNYELKTQGLDMFFFFLVPTLVASVFAGRVAGFTVATVGVIFWILADVLVVWPETLQQKERLPIIILINTITRLGSLLMIAYFTGRIRALIRQNRTTAHIDQLTGAYNRAGFFDAANRELSRDVRYNRSVSIARIDIKDFKKINEKFGNRIGDLLLQTMVRILKRNLRSSDIVSRVGSDEFAILFSETGKDAVKVMEKIQHKILDIVGKNGWPISLNTGIVSCTEVHDSVESLLEKADELMNQARIAGTNVIKSKVL